MQQIVKTKFPSETGHMLHFVTYIAGNRYWFSTPTDTGIRMPTEFLIFLITGLKKVCAHWRYNQSQLVHIKINLHPCTIITINAKASAKATDKHCWLQVYTKLEIFWNKSSPNFFFLFFFNIIILYSSATYLRL